MYSIQRKKGGSYDDPEPGYSVYHFLNVAVRNSLPVGDVQGSSVRVV